MEAEKNLEKNLDILSHTDPQLVVRLELLDPPDLNFLAPHTWKQQAAKQWFDALPLEGVEVLVIYGIDGGEIHTAAKEWLKEKKERHLVFIEESLEILQAFLTLPEATSLLEDPQLQIHYLQWDRFHELIEKMAWFFVDCSIHITAIPIYKKEKDANRSDIEHALLYEMALKHALIDEYLHYGIAFFRNYYPNLFLLEGAYLGNGLFGKAKGIPAIICGAGPSLNKNAHLLKTLSDRALIFAGGSSLNALLAQNIRPHFGAGIDPNAEQRRRIQETQHEEIPFFYRNRMFHEALKAIKGPRLYITGSGGYDIAPWVESQLGIEGETIEEGHNIVHFCTEIARSMGCNPILFVGLDLAFTDNVSYASGVNGSLTKKIHRDDIPIERSDIEGKPITTLWKWVAEQEWLADFAKTYPDLTLINATEGGLGIPGVPNQSLKEAINSFSPTPKIQKLFHHELPLQKLSVTKKEISELLHTLKDSLHQCESLCEQILEEVDVIKNNIAHGKFSHADLQTGRSALFEDELANEPAYIALLDIFVVVLTRLFQRDVQRTKSFSSSLSPQEIHQRLLEISAKRFLFLKETARLHQELIVYTGSERV